LKKSKSKATNDYNNSLKKDGKISESRFERRDIKNSEWLDRMDNYRNSSSSKYSSKSSSKSRWNYKDSNK
jgi:uncharacterized protein Smg (DUF494 family)